MRLLLTVILTVILTGCSGTIRRSFPLKSSTRPHSSLFHGSKVKRIDDELTAVAAHNKRVDFFSQSQKIVSNSNSVTLPWYTKVFPVKTNELPKFITLSSMMFWIIFIFTMSRDTKDTLIVTSCGAEAITFLKVYGVVPAAAAFMLAYAKLANTLNQQTLFYVTLAPFFLFYLLFSFVLYPMRDVIHPMHLALPPGGLSYAVNLIRHWSFSLYYIVTELWGSAGVPLLFWSCANSVVDLEQSRRIYPLLALIGNIGPVFSGVVMSTVTEMVRARVSDESRVFEISLKILTSLMTTAAGIVASLHWYVQRLRTREAIPTVPDSMPSTNTTGIESLPTKKPKLSAIESLRVLLSDKYLRDIGTMVICYGLSIEFTEIIWKAAVRRAFPSNSDYLAFMGRYSASVGILASVMMLVGANITSRFGWRVTALTTPVMMGLLAIPFFGILILKGVQSREALMIAVYTGLAQNAMSKAIKYAVFDPSKEMCYIPLDKEAKTKGKAAIDVLGARLGKSGGALSQQLLVLLFGSIVRGAPVLSVLFGMVISIWIGAVNSLSPAFNMRSLQQNF